jgi:hypothetical protein
MFGMNIESERSMTKDESIELARQAGIVVTGNSVLKLCQLVEEREREACLEIIDNFVDFPYLEPTMKAIKARGQA